MTLQENFTGEAFGNPDAHGTAVAIIAANDDMYSGMAPEAASLSYKVFRSDNGEGEEFQGILAVQHAFQDGAHIANCSWGSGFAADGTSREARAFDAAWTGGMILVKSAGNSGPGANSLTAPADADGVIVVQPQTAKERPCPIIPAAGRQTTASIRISRRPGARKRAASTPVSRISRAVRSGQRASAQFAAPLVAGAAALLRQQMPDATPDEIRARLVSMCRRFNGDEPNLYGAGILDFSASV